MERQRNKSMRTFQRERHDRNHLCDVTGMVTLARLIRNGFSEEVVFNLRPKVIHIKKIEQYI